MAQLTCFKGSWAIYPPFFPEPSTLRGEYISWRWDSSISTHDASPDAKPCPLSILTDGCCEEAMGHARFEYLLDTLGCAPKHLRCLKGTKFWFSQTSPLAELIKHATKLSGSGAPAFTFGEVAFRLGMLLQLASHVYITVIPWAVRAFGMFRTSS